MDENKFRSGANEVESAEHFERQQGRMEQFNSARSFTAFTNIIQNQTKTKMRKLFFTVSLMLIITSYIIAQDLNEKLRIHTLSENSADDSLKKVTDLHNSIIAGYGFAPAIKYSEYKNVGLSLKYFRKIKERFQVGGGFEFYPITLVINGMGYYDIEILKDRIDLLGGAGISAATVETGLLIRPTVSIKLDVYLSRLSLLGIETKVPLIFAHEKQNYLKSTYILGYFGLKF